MFDNHVRVLIVPVNDTPHFREIPMSETQDAAIHYLLGGYFKRAILDQEKGYVLFARRDTKGLSKNTWVRIGPVDGDVILAKTNGDGTLTDLDDSDGPQAFLSVLDNSHANQAWHSSALEGYRIHPETIADTQRVLDGTMSEEEAFQRILKRHGVQK